jgi:hypothetical protein
MRAREFITERQLAQRKSDTLSTTFHFPTMPSSNAYSAYRFGMAMADHTLTHAEGPAGNSAVIVAYTPEEEEIIQAGTRQTGHKGRILANRGSEEPSSTDTLSPVAKPKRNRYGV